MSGLSVVAGAYFGCLAYAATIWIIAYLNPPKDDQ